MPAQSKHNPFKNIKALTDASEPLVEQTDAEESVSLDEPTSVRLSVPPEMRIDVEPPVAATRREGRANKPGFQKVTVYIPDELYTKLKIHSVTARIDLYKIAEDAFTQWIEEHER